MELVTIKYFGKLRSNWFHVLIIPQCLINTRYRNADAHASYLLVRHHVRQDSSTDLNILMDPKIIVQKSAPVLSFFTSFSLPDVLCEIASSSGGKGPNLKR